MPVAENLKLKAEELRTKVKSRIEEIRTGTSGSEHSPLIGKLGILKEGGLMKGTLMTDLKEKGVLATARAKIESIRGGGGILGGGILGHSSSSIAEKVTVEKDSGALKQYRKRLAIEA